MAAHHSRDVDWPPERRIARDAHGHASVRPENRHHLGNRAPHARAEIVRLTASATLEERHVSRGDVAYVAEVAHRVEVAGAYHRLRAARLDARDLAREGGAHERRVLPAAGMVERPDA